MSRTKRFLAMLLAVVMVMSMVPGNVFATEVAEVAEATETPAAVQALLAAVAAGSLSEDIDLGGATLPAIALTGNFNGNNKTICNAVIANADEAGNLGFFSTIASGATVSNLKLENIQVEASNTSATNVGLIAGVNTGTINNVTVSGAINDTRATRDDIHLGVLVGANNGTITPGTLTFDFEGTDAKGVSTKTNGANGHSKPLDYTASYCAAAELDLAEGVKIGLVGTGTAVSAMWRQLSQEQSDTIEKRREKAVDYMADTARIKWSSAQWIHFTETVDDNSTWANEEQTWDISPSAVYYGPHYTHMISSMEQALYYMGEPDADGIRELKDIVHEVEWGMWPKNAEGGRKLGFTRYFASDCSGSISWAWNHVSPAGTSAGGALIITTYEMVPTPLHQSNFGMIPIGGYTVAEDFTSTSAVVAAMGDNGNTLYEAFAQAKQGDAIVSYEKGRGGHSRMLAQDPIVVRNADGSIDPSKSFMIIHEMGSGYVATAWCINDKYTFAELNRDISSNNDSPADGTYLPVTMNAFHNEYLEAPSWGEVQEIQSPYIGKINSKYRIINAVMTVKDENGKLVSFDRNLGSESREADADRITEDWGTDLVVFMGADDSKYGHYRASRGLDRTLDFATYFGKWFGTTTINQTAEQDELDRTITHVPEIGAEGSGKLPQGKYTFTVDLVLAGGSVDENGYPCNTTLNVVKDMPFGHFVAPEIKVNAFGYTEGDWVSGAVKLDVENTDNGYYGNVTYYYSVDGGEWQEYTDAITHTEDTDADGVKYTFKAVHESGDESEPVEFVVKKDASAPAGVEVKCNEDEALEKLSSAAIDKFYKGDVTVTISANDTANGSGIDKVTYKLGDGEEQTATAVDGVVSITINEEFIGNISILNATDKAGNKCSDANFETEYFVVEKNAPSAFTVDTNGYESGTESEEAVTITVSGAEAKSGIARYEYSVDGGETWLTVPASEETAATVSTPGNVSAATLTLEDAVLNVAYTFRAVANSGAVVEAAEKVTVFIIPAAGQWPVWDKAEELPTNGIWKLANDVTVSANTDMTGDLYLNLNGKTVTRNVGESEATAVTSDAVYVYNTNSYALNIRDSGENGTVEVVDTAARKGFITAVYVCGGSFVLDGGTLDNSKVETNYCMKAHSGSGVFTGTVTVGNANKSAYKGQFVMNGGTVWGQHNTYGTAGYGAGSAIGIASGSVTIKGGTVNGWKAEADKNKTGAELADATTASPEGTVITANSNTTVTITGGTLNGSKALTHGGVIYGAGQTNIYISGGTITGGYAERYGGIYSAGTELVISGGVITGNVNSDEALAGSGNNVYKTLGLLTISDGRIDGGVSITNNGQMVLTGTPVINGKVFINKHNGTSDPGSIYIDNVENEAAATAVGTYYVVTDKDGKVTGLAGEWADSTSLPTSGVWKLVTDVTITANPADLTQNLTLDLNGHTITRVVEDATDKHAWVFRASGAHLIIEDSSAEQTGTVKMVHKETPEGFAGYAAGASTQRYVSAVLTMNASSKFTLNGGTLDNSAIIINYTANNCGTVMAQSGTFTMNGGVIKGQRNNLLGTSGKTGSAIGALNNAQVFINGGEIYGWADTNDATKPAAYAGSAIAATIGGVTITGGKIYGSTVSAAGYGNAIHATGNITIEDGEISGSVSAATTSGKITLSGTPVFHNGKDVDLIIVDTGSILIGETEATNIATKYRVLKDDEGNITGLEGEWIDGESLPTSGVWKLATNVTITANPAQLTEDLTLDLNGYTITREVTDDPDNHAWVFRMYGTNLTILDSSAEKTGTVKMEHKNAPEGYTGYTNGKYVAAVVVVPKDTTNRGSFALKGGTLDNSAIIANYNGANSGTVMMQSGTFTMDGGVVKGQKNNVLGTSGKTGSAVGALDSAAIIINGGEIYGWKDASNATKPAAYAGSAIAATKGGVTITDGKIYGSTVSAAGYGNAVHATGNVNIEGGEITGSVSVAQYDKNTDGKITLSGNPVFHNGKDVDLIIVDTGSILIGVTEAAATAGSYFIQKDKDGNIVGLANGWVTANALPTSGVWKLATDVTITDSPTELAQDLTIDLNGHTILREVTDSTSSAWVFRIRDKHLIIDDSSAEKTGTVKMEHKNASADYAGYPSNGFVAVVNVQGASGKFTLEGGTLDNSAIIANYTGANSGTILMSNGIFTMNGGVIKGQKNNALGASGKTGSAVGALNSAKVFIYGGEIYGWENPEDKTQPAAYAGSAIAAGTGSVTIDGGKIYGSTVSAAGYGNAVHGQGTITISDGEIIGSVSADTTSGKIILTGKPVVSGTNGDVILIKDGSILINETKAAATAGKYHILTDGEGNITGLAGEWTDEESLPTEGNWKLTANVTVSAQYELTGDLYLDLNGHDITYTTEVNEVKYYPFRVDNGAKMVIDDTSAGEPGTISAQYTTEGAVLATTAALIHVAKGSELVVKNGIFDVSNLINDYSIDEATGCGAILVAGEAKAVIEGGIFKGFQGFRCKGGAIGGYANSEITISGGTFYAGYGANVEQDDGTTKLRGNGGVVGTNGTLTITGGEFIGPGNDSTKVVANGGLIACYGPELTITGGTFQNGYATGYGLNIYYEYSAGKVTIGDEAEIKGGLMVRSTNASKPVSLHLNGTPSIERSGGRPNPDHNLRLVNVKVYLNDDTTETVHVTATSGTDRDHCLVYDCQGKLYGVEKGNTTISGHINGDDTTCDICGYDPTHWTSKDSLPTSGVWKLATDVTITANPADLTQDLTLDLNGHTVTREVTNDGVGKAWAFRPNGVNLTILDSSAAQTGTVKMVPKDVESFDGSMYVTAVYVNGAAGKFTLESGTLDNSAIITAYNSYRSGTVMLGNGTFEMNGGVIKGQKNTNTNTSLMTGSAIGALNSGVIIINGGEIYAWKDATPAATYAVSAIAAANKGVTVNGGKIYGSNVTVAGYGSAIHVLGNVVITDGEIDGSVSVAQYSSSVPGKITLSGEPVFHNGEDVDLIIVDTGSILLGEDEFTMPAKYSFVRDAKGNITGLLAKSLPTSGTHTLTVDVETSANTDMTGALTLDLNGHTVTRKISDNEAEKHSYAIKTNAYKLTIKDTSAEQNGTVKMVYAGEPYVYKQDGLITSIYISASAGAFDLQGGILDNTAMISAYGREGDGGGANSGTVTAAGTFNMTGGKIYGQRNVGTFATRSGSAIGVWSDRSVTISGGEVYGWRDPADQTAGKTGSSLMVATHSGAVISAGARSNLTISGTAKIVGSHVAGNGGAISTVGNLSIDGATISGGYADGLGHNIYFNGQTIDINDAQIDGGVYIQKADSAKISGNTTIENNVYGLKLAAGQVVDFTELTGKVYVDAEGVFTTEFANEATAQAMLDGGKIAANNGCNLAVTNKVIQATKFTEIFVDGEKFEGTLADAIDHAEDQVKDGAANVTVEIKTDLVENGALTIPKGVTVKTADGVELNLTVDGVYVSTGATLNLGAANLNAEEILVYKDATLNLGESNVKIENYIRSFNGGNLNLGKANVYAQGVYIPDSASLIADPAQGKLHVGEGMFIITGDPVRDKQGYQIMPVWDPVENCYEFSRFQVLDTDSNNIRGLKVDVEKDEITFQFKHNATKAINLELLGKATERDENDIRIYVELNWTEAAGKGYWNGFYEPEQVRMVANGYTSEGRTPQDYLLTLKGFFDGREGVSEIRARAYIVFNESTHAVYGQEFTWTAG